jgi:hypothetical protein
MTMQSDNSFPIYKEENRNYNTIVAKTYFGLGKISPM